MAAVSSIEDVDVVVVGLGPAGALAAAGAAEAGLNVVAFERKKTPGQPVQCAEFVPAMLHHETAHIKAVTQQLISHMRSFVEGQPPDDTADFRGHMIDRDRFDAQMVAQARAMGARCEIGIGVAAISADGILQTTDGRCFRPRVLIGADGPRSIVGRAMGSRNTELVETRQITVALLQPLNGTDIFLRADIVGGYGWLFPKGSFANLGLGVVPNERDRLKPLLHQLHGELQEQGRVSAEIIQHTGGAIPVGGMIKCLGKLGTVEVLLAGDAAGLTNPITGAGIPAAIHSGMLAGAALRGWFAGAPEALAEYEVELEDLYQTSLERACRRRAEMLSQYDHGGRPDAAALRRGWIAYDAYWAA